MYDCNTTVVGLNLNRKNELLFINIFISSLCDQGKSSALSFATQHIMPCKIRRKVGNEMSSDKVPCAYPVICEIQGEAVCIFSVC